MLGLATCWGKQPPQVSLLTNFQVSTLSGLGRVSGLSDWSEEKKKRKSASIAVSAYES